MVNRTLAILQSILIVALTAPSASRTQTQAIKLWYHGERAVDLTGDGVPELITVTGYETSRVDSFTFVVNVISRDGYTDPYLARHVWLVWHQSDVSRGMASGTQGGFG